MGKSNPSALAAKWASKTAASVEQYKTGVQGVQGNPAQKAIQAKDRWQAAVSSREALDRFEDGLSKVSEADWKKACVEKGATAIAAGARLGAAKVEQHEREFGPIRDQIVSSLPERGTLDQNIERMTQMARKMAESRKRR